jgi:hypothetical protein
LFIASVAEPAYIHLKTCVLQIFARKHLDQGLVFDQQNAPGRARGVDNIAQLRGYTRIVNACGQSAWRGRRRRDRCSILHYCKPKHTEAGSYLTSGSAASLVSTGCRAKNRPASVMETFVPPNR